MEAGKKNHKEILIFYIIIIILFISLMFVQKKFSKFPIAFFRVLLLLNP